MYIDILARMSGGKNQERQWEWACCGCVCGSDHVPTLSLIVRDITVGIGKSQVLLAFGCCAIEGLGIITIRMLLTVFWLNIPTRTALCQTAYE